MSSAQNRRWWILVAMTGSLAMIMIDHKIVSVALPRIQRDLDLSQARLGKMHFAWKRAFEWNN